MQIQWRHALPIAAFLAWTEFAPAAHCAPAAEPSSAHPAGGADASLEEIVVTATLRTAPAIEVPASVTVLSREVLQDAGQQSLEDVLGLIPNLNWAGDTSRPRYFQLRGIGELEQYQGAPNPSVGFLIDDIDFSGLGTVGTLYDIDQVEVLRGPQATRYGANALAGLIYLRSAEPTSALSGRVDLTGGDYNTRSFGAVIAGPAESLDSGFRLAVQRYTTDGYYHNLYLHRYDTNGRDELTLRGKWTFSPSERFHVDLAALHVQIDNGYDAYAIDNSRNTQSDNPSVDSQHSTGLSLRAHYVPGDDIGLTFIATYAKTLVKYGYDGDWGNPILWAPVTDLYNYTELQYRDRTTKSAEIRLGSEASSGFAWLVGAYANRLNESLDDTNLGAYDDVVYGSGLSRTDTVINSAYRARNGALFGELDGDLAGNLRWSVGLRGERWAADYMGTTTDFIGGTVTPAALSPSNNLWGGHATLTGKLDANQAVYAQVARGYKAGGFNLSQGLLPNQLLFNPESAVNWELGYKADVLEHRLKVNGDIFYLTRRDAQIKTSFQSDPKDPNTFVFYTGNAARGHDYGLESDADWRLSPAVTVGGSLGLLRTYFENFVQQGASGTTLLSVSRELANAPHWQAALNATVRDPRGAFARVDVSGMGSFFYDLPPNPTRSHAYGLVNAKLGWERGRWGAYLWGRNLLDKNYTVRGFFFGDEPPDFNNKLYVQLGEPRTWGASVTVKFGQAARTERGTED
ncbi:MAG TPA: TonB-dependent receptor plug domain-containing protein [Steroidobacteraceae bacterium]|nr:TonB-dependent receptor plug domain-containing protein [Steroidobacteraceae bacterium]